VSVLKAPCAACSANRKLLSAPICRTTPLFDLGDTHIYFAPKPVISAIATRVSVPGGHRQHSIEFSVGYAGRFSGDSVEAGLQPAPCSGGSFAPIAFAVFWRMTRSFFTRFVAASLSRHLFFCPSGRPPRRHERGPASPGRISSHGAPYSLWRAWGFPQFSTVHSNGTNIVIDTR